MPQIFRPHTNALARYGFPLVVGALVLITIALVRVDWSPWYTRQSEHIEQPVPFSHEHHVSGLGIDCRYCHTSVETAATAGMPPTHTCMSCHAQLWTEAPVLEPVRASFRNGQPIAWRRVHDLPDYVYFNHSIHVARGVGCETCHGRVDQMPLTYKAKSLFMEWCLQCHRQPERFLRPKEFVYAFGYELPEASQRVLGRELVEQFGIDSDALTDCSICHR